MFLDSEKSEDTAAKKPMDQQNLGLPEPASNSSNTSQHRQFNAEPVKLKIKKCACISRFHLCFGRRL